MEDSRDSTSLRVYESLLPTALSGPKHDAKCALTTELEMDAVTTTDDLRLWLDAHQLLWRLDEFSALARFHACIHDADEELSTKLRDEVPTGLGAFKRLELTSNGREIGGDVPRWWVFRRESNVQELRDTTHKAFTAVQTLLRSSERTCIDPPTSYQMIIQELSRFLQDHTRELHHLVEYAGGLASKDELAPAILFSYAVWGSTRRGDRSLPAKSQSTSMDRLLCAGELALGIRRQHEPTIYGEWHDLLEEAHSSQRDIQSVISGRRLLHRAQVQIRERLMTYLTQLRDSLRHIDYLCQEYSQREHLYESDHFAKSLLGKVASQSSAVETELWDIKKTLEVWDASGGQKELAAIRFVERVAAFANNRGGVLIIGVADKTHTIVGVRDPESRIKHILRMLNTYADAEADFVKVRAVNVGQAGVKRICVIIVVGETDSPVGVRQKDKSYAYPLRVGPGIDRVSRAALLNRKAHKKGTSFAFTRELNEWVSRPPDCGAPG